jgi:hypothetical protein
VNPNEQRYTAVAILSNLFVGWWMRDAIDETATQARAIAAFQAEFKTTRVSADGDYVSLKIGVDVNVTAKAPQ